MILSYKDIHNRVVYGKTNMNTSVFMEATFLTRNVCKGLELSRRGHAFLDQGNLGKRFLSIFLFHLLFKIMFVLRPLIINTLS